MAQTASSRHVPVLILGGGTAGITVAARLRRADSRLGIAIVEPSADHYYQPLWTLVGAGVFPLSASRRREADYIPQDVTWIRDRVAEILPAAHAAVTAGGERITYDWLVVALGIQINWSAIPGLAEGIGTRGICSNYAAQHVGYTWESIRGFQGGTALFTTPNTAVKCGGAPQKIMYLADDAFRRQGVRDRTRLVFASPAKGIFAVEKYRRTLAAVVERKGIETAFRHHLVSLEPDAREAVLENLDTHERLTMTYDMIHVTPPMGPPDVVRSSPLADEQGWCAANTRSEARRIQTCLRSAMRPACQPQRRAQQSASRRPFSLRICWRRCRVARSAARMTDTHPVRWSPAMGRWCSPSLTMTATRPSRFRSISRRSGTACGS